jgi:hypothetical protein
MKPLIDYVKEQEYKNSKIYLASKYAIESGFIQAGKKSIAIEKGYIAIQEGRIIQYLRELVKQSTNKPISRFIESSDVKYIDGSQSITVIGHVEYKLFCYEDFYTKRFCWVETLTEKYSNIPPAFVYKKLIIAKEQNIFDYFTVSTIEVDIPLKDPLLLGRINGDTNRYFIAQWDDDIQLDNLI